MVRALLCIAVALSAVSCAYKEAPTSPAAVIPPPPVFGPEPAAVSQPVIELQVSVKAGPADPTIGEPAVLTAESNAVGTAFRWTFGDGQQAMTTLNRTSHTYTRAGDYSISVHVTDELGRTAIAHNLVRVQARDRGEPKPDACPTITISPTNLPGGTVDSNYSRTLAASGGKSPYAFGLEDGSGSPPAGLLLSGMGVLSGTPTAAETATFIVRVFDDNNCQGLRSYTMVVGDRPGVLTAAMSCTAHLTLDRASCNVTGTFNSATVPSAQVTRVDWDWGDGTVSNSTGPAQTHDFAQPGTYTVVAIMTATTSAGSKSATAIRSVEVPKPTP